MKRYILALAAVLLAGAMLWGQRARPGAYPQLEVKAIFPRETAPGVYEQVPSIDLQQAALEGWELVSVMPYVYRNEERGKDTPKAVVTQTYPAYFFKRARSER